MALEMQVDGLEDQVDKKIGRHNSQQIYDRSGRRTGQLEVSLSNLIRSNEQVIRQIGQVRKVSKSQVCNQKTQEDNGLREPKLSLERVVSFQQEALEREVGGCRRLRTVGKDNRIGEVSSTEDYGTRDVGGWLGGSGGKRSMWSAGCLEQVQKVDRKGRQVKRVGRSKRKLGKQVVSKLLRGHQGRQMNMRLRRVRKKVFNRHFNNGTKVMQTFSITLSQQR